MCQHSWYDKRCKRRYGRKPNTRRARGLRRRDFGKKRIVQSIKTFNSLPSVGVEKNVEVVDVPKSMVVLKRYIKIYNWYVNKYQLYRDKEYCIEMVMDKFGIKQKQTVIRAIKVCKFILATTPIEENAE